MSGRLGTQYHNAGIQNRACFSTSTPIFHNRPTILRQKIRDLNAGHRETKKGHGYPNSPRFRTRSRVLFKSFCSSHAGWNGASNPKSEIIQPVHQIQQVQDGIHSVGRRKSRTGRIPGIARYKGRVPSRSHLEATSEVPVHCSTVRSFLRAEGVHQDHGDHGGRTSNAGGHDSTIPGRPVAKRAIHNSVTATSTRNLSVSSTWVDAKFQKVAAGSVSTLNISRPSPGCGSTEDLPDGRQNAVHPRSGPTGSRASSRVGPSMHSPARKDGGLVRGATIRQVSFKKVPTRPPLTMVRLPPPDESIGQTHTRDSAIPPVVVTGKISTPGPTIRNYPLDPCNHGRQPSRMGSSGPRTSFPRTVVTTGNKAFHKCTRTESNCEYPTTSGRASPGSSSSDPVRQRHGCGIRQPSRRNRKQGRNGRGATNPFMGRTSRDCAISGVHFQSGQLGSGLPQSPGSSPGGMGSSSRSLLPDNKEMGSARYISHGVQAQQKGCKIRVQDQRSGSSGGRRSVHSLGFRPSVPVSSAATSSTGTQENQEREGNGDSGSSGLATQSVVFRPATPVGGRPVASARQRRSTPTRTISLPRLSAASFDGVAIETTLLKRRGIPAGVIPTMLRARKPVTSAHYYRIWKAYVTWCETRQLPTTAFNLARLLRFLQEEFSADLRLGSLKVQVSALSVFFHRKLATLPEVHTFLQGVLRLQPPFVAPTEPWDLSLVLAYLQLAVFEPLESVDLRFLTCKTAFLLALASARRVSDLGALSCTSPYLVFHTDRAELRTRAGFLPKVVSAFHINQPIVVPVLLGDLSSLDVVRALRIYVNRTQSIRKSDGLFVLFDAVTRGWPASKQSIAGWIRWTIRQAYVAAAKTPPTSVSAHSTRSVGPSWAAARGVSLSQLCRAATWSSPHTFIKFYRFDTFTASSSQFGRAVLQGSQRPPARGSGFGTSPQ